MLQESGLQLWTGLDVGSIAVFEVETGWVAQFKRTLFAACVEFEHFALRHTYEESCLRWFRGKLHQFVFLEIFQATESTTNKTILLPEQPPSFTVLSCLTRYDHCDHAAQMVVALAFCSKTSAVFALSAHRSGWHEDYYCGSTKSAELKLWGDTSWTCQACYHLGHRLVCLPAEVPGRTDDVWVPQPPGCAFARGLWNHSVTSKKVTTKPDPRI